MEIARRSVTCLTRLFTVMRLLTHVLDGKAFVDTGGVRRPIYRSSYTVIEMFLHHTRICFLMALE